MKVRPFSAAQVWAKEPFTPYRVTPAGKALLPMAVTPAGTYTAAAPVFRKASSSIAVSPAGSRKHWTGRWARMREQVLSAYRMPVPSDTISHLKHIHNSLSASNALNDAGRQIFDYITEAINNLL